MTEQNFKITTRQQLIEQKTKQGFIHLKLNFQYKENNQKITKTRKYKYIHVQNYGTLSIYPPANTTLNEEILYQDNLAIRQSKLNQKNSTQT